MIGYRAEDTHTQTHTLHTNTWEEVIEVTNEIVVFRTKQLRDFHRNRLH